MRSLIPGALAALLTSVPALALAESEFERFIADSGGLTTSFPRLIYEGRARELPSEIHLLEARTLVAPMSRSIQRQHSTFAQPRRLGVFGRTFLGYVESVGEMEVISWNATDSRFDFFRVRNYVAGSTPTIEKMAPGEAACLQCHQHGGPIFPGAPWSEFDGPIGHLDQVYQEVVNARAAAGLPSLSRWIDGAPRLQERLSGATFYDSQLREANLGAQFCQAFNTACGDDLECRRQNLLLGLTQAAVHSPRTLAGRRRDRTALLALRDRLRRDLAPRWAAHWPEHGFAYPSSRLPDRRIELDRARGGQIIEIRILDLQLALQSLVNSGLEFMRANLPAGATSVPETEIAALRAASLAELDDPNYRDGFEARDRLEITAHIPGIEQVTHWGPSPGEFGDPAVLRPRSSAATPEFLLNRASQLAVSCMGMDWASDRVYLDSMTSAQLEAIATSTGAAVTSLLAQWPPTRAEIQTLVAVFHEGGLAALNALPAFTRVITEPAPHLVPEAPAAPEQSPTQLFQNYCGACHSGPNSFAATLPLQNLSALRGYREGLVRDRLEGHRGSRMPPRFLSDEHQPTEAERAVMTRALAN